MDRLPKYCSYLLRLWQTLDGEEQGWRASLEPPGSNDRFYFVNLEELLAFLERETRWGKGESETGIREN